MRLVLGDGWTLLAAGNLIKLVPGKQHSNDGGSENRKGACARVGGQTSLLVNIQVVNA
jgi:hypothetical protein